MHPLIALLGAAAACVLVMARPPDGSQEETRALMRSLREVLGGVMQPRNLQVPRYMALDEGHRLPEYNNWLSREINRLNFLDDDDEMDANYQPMEEPEEAVGEGLYQALQARLAAMKRYHIEVSRVAAQRNKPPDPEIPSQENLTHEEKMREFALTPFDKGYYDVDADYEGSSHTIQPMLMSLPIHRRDSLNTPFEVPRQIRQNPNLSKTKTLVAENLDKLRAGMAGKDYRVPISLLPTNLRILKVPRDDDNEKYKESSHENLAPSPVGHLSHMGQIHKLEGNQDPTESIYGVALMAAAGAALTVTALVAAFGWYTISKKAKAAANVEYPAYGVTGPATDVTGDRKLAHSAHMYHYQHQKQQILAMERNGLEQRDGSVTDPESEEENEEGDYTVYECPGFASTGDIEVKNPMFSDEPTPATPGTCELVKPQPKE